MNSSKYLNIDSSKVKLKVFAEDKGSATHTVELVLEREENMVEKGGNAGTQYLLLLPQCFQKAFSSGLLLLYYRIQILNDRIILSSANASNLCMYKIFLFGKKLSLSHRTDFRLSQTESVYRRQF